MDHDEISHGHDGRADNDTARDENREVSRDEEEKMQPTEPFEERDIKVGYMNEADRQIYESGIQKFSRLGWKRLTVVLIVEAIALGSLSIPSTFATLGMVAGVICTVGLGLVAIYTSWIIGKVKLAFPEVAHYADVGRLMGARLGCPRFGFELINLMLAVQLLFLTGSHCLTGTIAFLNITKSDVCSVVFGVVSAVILLLLAVPPSFTEMAVLGYIDFASIIIAIGITIIATGVDASNAPGGLAAVNWSAWPKEGISFYEAFVSVTNIVFAYSFALCQFSFMDEMHTPRDYVKSIWALGIIEIVIYTLTGALIYAFVGQDVQSPALLSAGSLLKRVAFGIALPVIFISGSINTVVFGRLVHGRIFANSQLRFINTPMGWITWLAVIAAGTVIAFIIAEVIPFFNDLLSISSSLFISGFTFYFPPMMWVLLLKKGSWREPKNIILGVVNLFVFIIGIVTLAAGTYASIADIISKYDAGTVHGVFTCGSPE
ncbi:hypothetical protein N7520_007993 [Penicillium odoratum]|uniref:uncharacterized protein n=1 Tax=Penicillium odoratum TaxID=1167516 RepID=UPI0025494BD8|nr:uncharacterized protein N7520_007993 [Penicillium odoratum]KAJ5760837.1 hypothetical protein N7520_007993 [Penicillium odoratum]